MAASSSNGEFQQAVAIAVDSFQQLQQRMEGLRAAAAAPRAALARHRAHSAQAQMIVQRERMAMATQTEAFDKFSEQAHSIAGCSAYCPSVNVCLTSSYEFLPLRTRPQS